MDGQPGRVGIEGREEGPADSQSWADRLLAGPMGHCSHAARLPPPAGSTCPPPSPHLRPRRMSDTLAHSNPSCRPRRGCQA